MRRSKLSRIVEDDTNIKLLIGTLLRTTLLSETGSTSVRIEVEYFGAMAKKGDRVMPRP